jgi:hypothetical protein
MRCAAGHDNASGLKFSGECGQPLSTVERDSSAGNAPIEQKLNSSGPPNTYVPYVGLDLRASTAASDTPQVTQGKHSLDFGPSGEVLAPYQKASPLRVALWLTGIWLVFLVPVTIASPDHFASTAKAVLLTVLPLVVAACLWILYTMFREERSPSVRENRIAARNAQQNAQRSIAARNASRVVQGITCPTCGHQQAERITFRRKAGTGAAFGVLSISYLGKTFKCQHCDYKW